MRMSVATIGNGLQSTTDAASYLLGPSTIAALVDSHDRNEPAGTPAVL